MKIGVPTEIKNHEYRVGLTPAAVHELVAHGHTVLVQSGAGLGVGYDDTRYQSVGATVVASAEDVFADSDMIIKVKEPLANERAMLKKEQILFTYLHLAPDVAQTDDLIKSGAVCIAYETVTSPRGGLPLLAPMSEVAGRMSIQAGAHCLEKANQGAGVLLGGVSGVAPAKVVIVGAGVVGRNAAQMAVGMNADVTILDNNVDTLRSIDMMFNGRIKTLFSNRYNIAEQSSMADLLIGSVLIPGAAAPKLVTADMIKQMKAGSAVVDVAIDQGGCFATSHPTTHAEPTFMVDDVVHYCVANMPGAVAKTATYALNNATLPFVVQLANKGYHQALKENEHLRNGLNVYKGTLTNQQVGESQNKAFVMPEEVII